ncbi:MAG: zinc ribbon domain-containing protein, partial [Thermoplasmatota archaeon]
ENEPGGWTGHGQVYSPGTKTHFIWAGEGTEVWEFNPVLWTTAVQIRMHDPDGETSGTSAIPVFPSMGTYIIKVVGISDLPAPDLIGIILNLTIEGKETSIEYTRQGDIFTYTGNESWFVFPDIPYFEFPKEGEWTFNVPIEFTFDIPHGVVVRGEATPITEIGTPETAQRSSLFRMISDLEIVSYDFSTPLQPKLTVGDYLFGRTNLTVSDFRIAFKEYPSISPVAGGLQVTLENHEGDMDTWDYMQNVSAELAVPIVGDDNQFVKFYLNLTSGGYIIDSLSFQFKLDLDPPSRVKGAAIRADSIDDDTVGIDNDNDVYLTWDGVLENGSGLKGICYSLDENLWPAEENLTNEFEMIRIRKEGNHHVYVWAIDKTGRVGPYVEIPITIDTHRVYFEDHQPSKRVNSTDGTHTFQVTVKDDLSGVDPDSIYYRKSKPDLSLTDWIKYEADSNVSGSVDLSITLDLVPGIVNLVTFKANDVADNGERNSDTFIVHYDPTLETPQTILEEPKEGAQVKGKIKLAWKGDYIEPDELSYEVHVIAPDGEERVFPTDKMSMDFTPDIPGEYRWYVVSMAEGKTNSSGEFSFFYTLDLAVVDLPSLATVEKGSDIPVEVKMENPLDIDLVLTFDLDVGKGFTIVGDSVFDLPAGEIVKGDLVLNSSMTNTGTHRLVLNVSDNYGRWQTMDLRIKVDPKPVDDDSEEEEEGISTITIVMIIVGVVVAIAVLLMLFLVIRAKKHEKDLDSEPDRFQCKHCGKMISEDDESCPHCGMLFSDGSMKDGEYNPEGIVKKGEGVDASIPMAPGTMERRDGSNALELEVPGTGAAPPEENMERAAPVVQGTEPPEE